MDATFLWCLAIRSAFFHFETKVWVRRRHGKPVELGGQQKKICWRGNISTDSRDGYCYHTFKMAINFVANFPIDKINLNLFVIISKTSKIYNPFFVLPINGHFESMVEVSDSALPTYFPPSNLLLLTAQLNWFSVSSSDTNFCLEVKEGWPDCQTP